MNYPSKTLESAVSELSRLPGIGRRTALRLALHLLRRPAEDAEMLGNAIIRLRAETRFCTQCNNISDGDLCGICENPARTRKIICVVEDVRDVMAIENTGQYSGLYHVLGGLISPMDGIGPDDLNLKGLIVRIRSEIPEELILALPATIEGDTTSFYLFKQISDAGLRVTTIARGISIGDELEYADEATLGRSIINRTPYSAGEKK